MAHLLSRGALDALCSILTGEITLTVGEEEEAVLIVAELPGRAVVSAARVKGVLYLVMDYDKPAARRQLCALLQEWRRDWNLEPMDRPSIPPVRPWGRHGGVANLALVV